MMLDFLNIPKHQINFWTHAPHEIKTFVNQCSVISVIVMKILLAAAPAVASKFASKGFSVLEVSAIFGVFTYVFLTASQGYRYRDKQT